MKLRHVVIATIMIALLVIAGGLGGGWLVKQKLEANLVNNYTQEETLIGRQIAETLQGRVQNIENTFETLAVNPVMQTGSTQACTATLKQVQTTTTLLLSNIVRANNKGIFTCSLTNPALVGTPVGSLGNYWQKLAQDPAHKPVLSHVIHNPKVPDLAIALHVPMYDNQHNFIGTVGGAFYLKQLANSYLDNVKFAQTGYASLLDDDYTVLYSHLPNVTGKNYFSDTFQHNASLLDLNKAVLKASKGQESIVRYTNFQQVHKIASVVPVTILPGHRWIIIVNVPLSEVSSTYISTGLNQAFIALGAIFCTAVLLISGLMIASTLRDARLKRTEDQFISLVSHQLRTPLTAIRLFSEMLHKGQVGSVTDKQADYIDKIQVSTLRMIRLVGEILNVSRVELNRLTIQPAATDLEPLIASYIEEVQPMATEKQITIDFKAASKPTVAIDQTLFGQVIHNLLTNAVRYSHEQGTVRVGLQQQGANYEISVADDGIGIPRAARRHIFERFYRAPNAIDSVGDGTGLGLYLVKMILEQSGCAIRLDSQEGQGTTFYVTIPANGMRGHQGDKQLEATV